MTFFKKQLFQFFPLPRRTCKSEDTSSVMIMKVFRNLTNQRVGEELLIIQYSIIRGLYLYSKQFNRFMNVKAEGIQILHTFISCYE